MGISLNNDGGFGLSLYNDKYTKLSIYKPWNSSSGRSSIISIHGINGISKLKLYIYLENEINHPQINAVAPATNDFKITQLSGTWSNTKLLSKYGIFEITNISNQNITIYIKHEDYNTAKNIIVGIYA